MSSPALNNNPSSVDSASTPPETTTTPAHSNAEVTTKTQVSSLAELKEKAPKVYEQMMVGIAMQICRKMEKSQARLKRIMREYRI